MKSSFYKYLILILIFLSLYSSETSTGKPNEIIQSVAVIIDAAEFYDEQSYDDILKGLEMINNTYGINYDIYQLENYRTTRLYPYNATYTFNNSLTNHTTLAKSLVNNYDMVAFIGYELRRGEFDPNNYPNTKFLYYDLAGDLPETISSFDKIPNNVIIVSFGENEIGFIAGTLAVATISPFPQKVLMIGTYHYQTPEGTWRDPRTQSLIAGFQSAILRDQPDVLITIDYIDSFWEHLGNYTLAKNLAASYSTADYGMIFTALQNNQTKGVISGLPGHMIIGTDSSRIRNVYKNNSMTLFSVFQTINKSSDFPAGYYTYRFADDVYEITDWLSDENIINETLTDLYIDIVEKGILIPTALIYAKNTSGFEVLPLFSAIFCIITLNIFTRKRRK
ncbi:BMP family ABC transporter substrate-binding protein [Candidatus Hodarchaeum mangrovi]